MIGRLISRLFEFILDLVMDTIQILCIPLNAIFSGVFPDFSSSITKIDNALNYAFDGLAWALNLIPPMVREVMLFIFTIELALLVIMRSTHITAKVWTILQKIKFW